ncbi:hypothetical protein BAOM_1060 [Peribacillus asahii]|uniref:Uncharacterized protein n=1 Tax=Peribacillus asahii TaxID=228899 RepID=A0A3T0KN79_9BACI|nr:hypothetical protein BAOM_1060 [Peribacillus asahii]
MQIFVKFIVMQIQIFFIEFALMYDETDWSLLISIHGGVSN